MEHNSRVNFGNLASLDQNFLWASMLWGAVASGYFVYGWKQKSAIPLAAGAVMTGMSFIGPNALVMSLVCIATIFLNWWLMKNF
jgi:hypothetical protein